MSHKVTAQKIVGTTNGPHALEPANVAGKRVLVISDEAPAKERRIAETCVNLEAKSVMATHYGDKPKTAGEGIEWKQWDWVKNDLDTEQKFDLIIARSMVCPCEPNEHVDMGTHQLKGTCGGIPLPGKKASEIQIGDLDKAKEVFERVDGLLAHNGLAFFTNSPMPTMFNGSYKLGRKYSYPMWKTLLGASFKDRFQMFLEKDEDSETYIGFCIVKR